MARQAKPVPIELLETGVPSLDAVLGGGLPTYSLSIIAGPAGSGKTTLAQQIMFHQATSKRPAIYLSALGEPLVKLLRYQQQFSFFDARKVGKAIHFIDLAEAAKADGLEGVLAGVRKYLEQFSPALVVFDSIRAVQDVARETSGYSRRVFIHDLALTLAAWQTTALLVGEYVEEELNVGPEMTIADNLLLLGQEVHQNATIRKLRVVKMRGLAPQSGRHSFRISEQGIHIYPRLAALPPPRQAFPLDRAKFGVPGLDEMMRGGLPRGETCIVAGSSGTGKTLLGLHFIVEGARVGSPSVMVTFEEDPREHIRKAASFGWDLEKLERDKLLKMIYLRPVDLSIDEVLGEIASAVAEIGACRVVINSVSGLEIALPGSEKSDFREGLYRMVASLTAQGANVLLTVEVPELMGDVHISEHGISFIADDIILLRYVEIASALRKVLMVIKMRTSDHDKEMREYHITPNGVAVQQPFTDYSGVLSGIPTLRAVLGPQPFTAGLTEREESLMHILLSMRQASPQDLAQALSMNSDEVASTLEKLTETGYVVKSMRAGKPVYRVGLVTPGLRPPDTRR
ncbi:MAG: protein kinase [Chloroflexota bacterium]|nr:MAG: protein kinase [Chloroflexota bacterium]